MKRVPQWSSSISHDSKIIGTGGGRHTSAGKEHRMNFNDDITRITNELLADGTVDKILREHIEAGFTKAIDDSFKWGELNNAIKKRVTEVLVPFIEGYDMSAYITKLDTVLTDIINQTCLQDNAKILENFRSLMTSPEEMTVTVSEIFKRYKEYVATHMDTSGREVQFEDDVNYEPMDVFVEFVEDDDRSWSCYKYATLELSVGEEEQEENLNFSIRLSRWKSEKKEGYEIEHRISPSVCGLAGLNEFDVYLLRLSRAGVRVLMDVRCDEDYVYSEEKPEATYS